MKSLETFAAVVLGAEMPVPVYWIILHGRVNFWRRHVRAGYWVAVLAAWGCGDALLYAFRRSLFHGAGELFSLPALWPRIAGLALIALDILILTAVETQLGGHCLVGHAELTGRGELATSGLYRRLRHPRYLGMMATVLGACLLIDSRPLWILGLAWWLAALAIIRIEERELHRRFGAAYADYARRVPALLPLRFTVRHER